MKPLPSALFCSFAVLASAACSDHVDQIVLAAPSSLQQSGFTDFIVPAFESEFGVRVTVVATHQLLNLARAGGADIILGHEPDTEQQLIDEGIVHYYRKVMFNRFLLVGPDDDPAGVRGARNVADALARIAASGALFLSRGDGSATDARDRQLWILAGASPVDRLETHADMAETLREASARAGYTLTVSSVYQRLRNELRVVPLFERDDAMLNTYAVAVRKDGPRKAQQFAEWLAEGNGRPFVERFRLEGRPVFSLWPVTAPSKTPASIPMYAP